MMKGYVSLGCGHSLANRTNQANLPRDYPTNENSTHYAERQGLARDTEKESMCLSSPNLKVDEQMGWTVGGGLRYLGKQC